MTKKKSETWILNAVIVTQNSSRRVLRGHIRIIDNRIVAVTPTRPRTISKDAETIDANGMAVIPGFIQAHIHLCQTLFRNQADDMDLLDWLNKRIWLLEAAHHGIHAGVRFGYKKCSEIGNSELLAITPEWSLLRW